MQWEQAAFFHLKKSITIKSTAVIACGFRSKYHSESDGSNVDNAVSGEDPTDNAVKPPEKKVPTPSYNSLIWFAQRAEVCKIT